MTKKKMWFYSFHGYSKRNQQISYGHWTIEDSELFSEDGSILDCLLKLGRELNDKVEHIHVISLNVIQEGDYYD